MSQKSKLLIESYKTKSGQVKNRYAVNPDAKVIGIIDHEKRSTRKTE